MTFSDRTNKDQKKKEKRERVKKTQPEAEAEVGESDPFRGVMFNQGLSAMQPHVWERPEYKGIGPQKSGIRGTTIDKKAVVPEEMVREMEERICPRCGVDLDIQKHKKGCPELNRPYVSGEVIDLAEWEKALWDEKAKEEDEIINISNHMDT